MSYRKRVYEDDSDNEEEFRDVDPAMERIKRARGNERTLREQLGRKREQEDQGQDRNKRSRFTPAELDAIRRAEQSRKMSTYLPPKGGSEKRRKMTREERRQECVSGFTRRNATGRTAPVSKVYFLSARLSEIMGLNEFLPHDDQGRAVYTPGLFNSWWILYTLTHDLSEKVSPFKIYLKPDGLIDEVFGDYFESAGIDLNEPISVAYALGYYTKNRQEFTEGVEMTAEIAQALCNESEYLTNEIRRHRNRAADNDLGDAFAQMGL